MPEQLGKNEEQGSYIPNFRQNILSGLGTTRTLTAAESGSLILFDTAAGLVVTLPAPVEGMTFDFLVTIDGTGSYSVDTDASTTFMLGAVAAIGNTAGTSDSFEADGTSIVSCDLDSDVTGEQIGSRLKFVGLSSTVWLVSGTTHCAGATLLTPFA